MILSSTRLLVLEPDLLHTDVKYGLLLVLDEGDLPVVEVRHVDHDHLVEVVEEEDVLLPAE
jgi:hypothetical protein